MDKAIGALRQRFTEPSADAIQQNPLCRICWNDYEGEDRPVKLPCGHLFGEECIIAWSRGITPNGRHNGCPYCRAELLPPSLHSRASALRNWCLDIWLFFRELTGGPREIALEAALWVASACTRCFPESKVAGYVRLGLDVLFVLVMTKRGASLIGWRHAIQLLWIQLAILLVKEAWLARSGKGYFPEVQLSGTSYSVERELRR